MSCACSQAETRRAQAFAPWLLVAVAGASIRLRCYRNQSLMGRRRQLELWQPRLPSVLLPLVRFEGMRVRRRLGPGTIGPWADAQHPYFKKRPRACHSEVPRARVPQSSICPHGTTAYVRPRRLASGRVPGVVVGLPWGHRRWDSHVELELELSPRRPAKKDRVCNTGSMGETES